MRVREPTLHEPVCQRVTQAQCESRTFKEWCEVLNQEPVMHRKLWEYAYILQCVEGAENASQFERGLGFGVGKEPLAAVFAHAGCRVVATDYAAPGWKDQHAASVQDLNADGICDAEDMADRIELRQVNMMQIPSEFHGQFDFVWSSCALEHLGSLELGAQFVHDSLKCLKPGGVAAHTTEMCINSDKDTISKGPTVLYRAQDLHRLIDELYAEGYDVERNMSPGRGEHDGMPAHGDELPHLAVAVKRFVTTSFGLRIAVPHEEQASDAVPRADVTHIVRPHPDADQKRWVMYCGLEVDVSDDGTLEPNLDFFASSAGQKATCPECAAAWGNEPS
jgi:2-polyprenyl-3-methyl-5-hydroxy-6-metoxy-1,4-benzoquinol methylase